MGIRRQSRECALQMLYQMDIGGPEPAAVKRHFWERPEADCSSKGFACELFDGVLSKLAEIDEIISKNSENWKLSRMASVDKNILRVAVFELLWKQDIPVKVSINEAVEIAKRFGTTDSGSFVNGILDNIAKGITKDVESSEDES